ncbi:LPXTG cell wall anchor domain-containing protein [Enterococcus sp.]|uniref:LPXTG cell wall anchor domain-containing protein n=1 Tax=Enterococcus sp. TaxID=35783 RepID=UPI002912CB48|nr:LPXTG cell wall anchor domain-containing protein [Enterococcus sp.]MDU5335454.1 LPXTG cell wall anchor domain-containing protein [Enterococcus sp.]
MKKRTSLILFSLLVLSFFQGPSSYAEEQDYHSHGVTSFYGVYEKPEQPGAQQPSGSDSSDSQGSQKNGSSNGSTTATPNYSASGQAIIPKTGDQSFVTMQVSGFVLLMMVVTYVWIQKKGENLK